MNLLMQIRRVWLDLLGAVQFLTRLYVPSIPFEQDALARAVKFFPIVGLLIGSGSGLIYFLLSPHLSLTVVALLIVTYLVVITGCMHEDGLADAADGFGGGWEREKVLAIMRDSRIGTYGAAALVLSLFARVLLIASLHSDHALAWLVVAPVLSRWTTLPLSFYLPSARNYGDDKADGQGARIARLTSRKSFIAGTVLALLIAFALLRFQAFAPFLICAAVTWFTAIYYRRRIDGITGDCFGATNQLSEIAVYLCGAWV